MLQEPVSRLCSGAAVGTWQAACGGRWEVFSSRPVLKVLFIPLHGASTRVKQGARCAGQP